MKKIQFLLIIFLAFLFGCQNQSDPDNLLAKNCCFFIGTGSYMCETGSPGNLVMNGKGQINAAVTGDNPPQFGQSLIFRPNNYNNGHYSSQNNTQIIGPHKLEPYDSQQAKIKFDVPK